MARGHAEGALKQAEADLQDARKAAADAAARVKTAEQQLAHALSCVAAALPMGRPRRLAVAYTLWLLTPLVWPGAYLFYLGRDTHALMHTISFGGFGLGWLLDGLYIPLYVRDHNEPPGYLERVSLPQRGLVTSLGGLLLAPFTLVLQLAPAVGVAFVAANLVPRPLVFPEQFGVPPLSHDVSAMVGCAVGMLALGICAPLASSRGIGRVRSACRWRPVMLWTGLCSALVWDRQRSQEPGVLLMAVVGVLLGAGAGRKRALERSPRACTSRRPGPRLLAQLVCVSACASAALGAFHLNGSYTFTSADSGAPTTISGAEALKRAYATLSDLTNSVGEAASLLRSRHHTWAERIAALREAFRDPRKEAAEMLGVSRDATHDEVKRAHRQLARSSHPDKVDPERQEIVYKV